jgi:hypothetical protein
MTRPIFEHDLTRKPLHTFRHHALSALCAAAVICAAAPALAAGQLAVGEVIPLEPPPGYAFRPVYTPPVLHSRWEPADSFGGRVFREPIYTTPPGYVYRYVRGYTRVRVADATLVRKVSIRKAVVRKTTVKRTGACVTELGYGRYELCR